MGNNCICKKKKPKMPPKPQKPNPLQPQQQPSIQTPRNETVDPISNQNEMAQSNVIRKNLRSNIAKPPPEPEQPPLKKSEYISDVKEIDSSNNNMTKVNDYSFIDINKNKTDNGFSFEVYGEDISALNPNFLMENLGNISNNSKINISRNELLLLTEENQEILKFLSDNNISRKDLIDGIGKVHTSGTFALDDKLRITNPMRPSKHGFLWEERTFVDLEFLVQN